MLHTIGLDSWPILNTDDAVTSFAICNLPSDRFHRGRVHTVGEGHRSLPLRRLDVESIRRTDTVVFSGADNLKSTSQPHGQAGNITTEPFKPSSPGWIKFNAVFARMQTR